MGATVITVYTNFDLAQSRDPIGRTPFVYWVNLSLKFVTSDYLFLLFEIYTSSNRDYLTIFIDITKAPFDPL